MVNVVSEGIMMAVDEGIMGGIMMLTEGIAVVNEIGWSVQVLWSRRVL